MKLLLLSSICAALASATAPAHPSMEEVAELVKRTVVAGRRCECDPCADCVAFAKALAEHPEEVMAEMKQLVDELCDQLPADVRQQCRHDEEKAVEEAVQAALAQIKEEGARGFCVAAGACPQRKMAIFARPPSAKLAELWKRSGRCEYCPRQCDECVAGAAELVQQPEEVIARTQKLAGQECELLPAGMQEECVRAIHEWVEEEVHGLLAAVEAAGGPRGFCVEVGACPPPPKKAKTALFRFARNA